MGVCRLAMVGKFRGVDDVRNIFTIQAADQITPNNAAATAWVTALFTTSGLMGALSNQVSYDRYILEIPNAEGHWIYQREVALSLVGGASSDYLPQQNAAVVVAITPSRRRGKKFIPGIEEGNQTGGVLNSDFKTILQTFGATWIAGFDDSSVHWSAGVCKSDGTDFLAFTGVRVDSLMGTQVRRKPGVGA